jgi:hypothetical protein
VARQPIKPQTHSWAVYHLKGAPAKLVGIVFDQPDEKSAVKQVIDKFQVPANQRGRPIA